MLKLLSKALGTPQASPVTSDPFGRFVIVSFYTAGGYYEEKAKELKAQCDRFGLEHEIAKITIKPNENWADICRRKVRFYHKMLHKHKCAIMWLDVDSKLQADIGTLHQGHFDMAAFMRNFKYLPQFNPGNFARTFHPGYLLFRYTPRTIQFLNDCIEIDRTHEGPFTDDYILEEALRTTSAQMRLMILSPDDLQRPIEPEKEGALFRHGNSGNVNEYKGKVKQHIPRILEPATQKRVLMEAVQALARQGRRNAIVVMMKRILQVDPTDFESYVKLLDMLRRFDSPKELAAELAYGRKSKTLAPYAIRFEMMRALEDGAWEKADALFEEIKQTGHQKMINFGHSRLFRFSLDRRAEAQKIPDSDRVSLFWWEEPFPGNLGDIINPYIVEKLTGTPPKYGPRGKGMCAIGSIIKFAKTDVPVWGSGSPHAEGVLAADADYRAVRGPLTRDLVLKNGGKCDKVYGDAAWFLPILHPAVPKKTHKTGLILHYTHEDAPLNVGSDLRRIDIRRLGYDQIEAFLDEVTSCERIISTSLHGVIIAQAYGIPAVLATASNSALQVHGDGIKFDDYFQSVGITKKIRPVDLSPMDDIDTIPAEDFLLAKQKINLTKLLDVAPFDALPEVRKQAAAFDAQ
ncbi:MAG: polysaccharide pyruvyl transferase family protein [Hyphomonas sp.]